MYETSVNGKKIIYYSNCLELDGVTIYYRDMEHITQSFEEQPVFRFGYNGRDIRIPCREDEYKTVLEYFITAADQSPTTDTVSFLASARQEKTDESRLDSFTEKKENRYQEPRSDTRSGSSYSYSYGKSTEKKEEWAFDEFRNERPEGSRSYNKHVFTWVFSFFFGMFGVDRFARGQIGLGVLKIFTAGGCGYWYLADWIIAAIKAYGRAYADTEDFYFNPDGSYTR